MSLESGSRFAAIPNVLMVSSLDEDHPGENVTDGSDRSYWISTGLYPQEILLELSMPAWVSFLTLSSTNVKQVLVEGCHDQSPVNFHALGGGDVDNTHGQLQLQVLTLKEQQQPVKYVRLAILSGWHDFCSVHRLQLETTVADEDTPVRRAPSTASIGGRARSNIGLMQRRPSLDGLEVDIPTVAGNSDEPVAPRSVHMPWKGIDVRVTDVSSGAACLISVDRTWTFSDLKNAVEAKMSIPKHQQIISVSEDQPSDTGSVMASAAIKGLSDGILEVAVACSSEFNKTS